jgi:hypothetical protein
MVKDAETVHTPGKTGPKPKQLEPFEKMGIAVGRDKTHVCPEEVSKLAALGVTTPEMADFFGIKESALKYNFQRELTKGRAELKITLRRNMLQNSHNMNASVQIFLAKNLLGMTDVPQQSDDHKPLPWIETKKPQEASAVIGKTSDLQIQI